MPATNANRAATLVAEDTWTIPTRLRTGGFNLSVQGTLDNGSTVSLQRSYTGADGDFFTVKSYTAVGEEIVDNVEPGVHWRIGIATGDFSDNDSVDVRLGQ
jgi:hypothetical protein